MKAVILAGGRGTRIAEESHVRPKPMISIGERPILWHIMNLYSMHGIHDFIVCLGYRGYVIKEYFANFLLHAASSVRFDLSDGSVHYAHSETVPWRVTLVETGENTQTGGRIKRISPLISNDSAFCLTYGDGLANINISRLISHHNTHGRLATITVVNPPGRFGAVILNDGNVTKFIEKPQVGSQVVNGGFFVLSPRVVDYIRDDDTIWEREPLENLATQGQLSAFPHRGFWQPMDTLRDRDVLEQLWATGDAPWTRKSEE